jgi:IS5 family transposase
MKTMKQLSLAETELLSKARKPTRKAVFLAEMEQGVPGTRLEGLIEPCYPKKGNGRPPLELRTLLRIHFLPPWFGYAAPALEEALYDLPRLGQLAGLDAFDDVLPEESTMRRFRHRLQKHALPRALLAEVKAVGAEKGLTLKRGSVVEATRIAAPSSTQNRDKQRDPEMSQPPQGNQW